ncbi:ubiquitin 3 binding protein But2 C-terminal domain-containing protein [Phaeosphaeria sp. MPI-PUGE-AT-0046c]|nr:ubiquitin 3 binding protein But2 C-terminal domain-containing protein [Phaeosphaeria sp. MPI-PUGE-AT-0046c]
MRGLFLLPTLFALGTVADLLHVDFPHLIIPLNYTAPNTAYGTKNSGEVSTTVYTEVSFDVPPDIPAKICRINFHINKNPVKNAPWTLDGAGPYQFLIGRQRPWIDKDKDTWNTYPDVQNYAATVNLTKDGQVTVEDGWFQCGKGEVAQFLLYANSPDMKLTWYELDYNEEMGGPHGVTLEMHS